MRKRYTKHGLLLFGIDNYWIKHPDIILHKEHVNCKKETKEMITIEELINKFNSVNQMPLEPDKNKFPVFKEGDVIDEDQSVRWNRETVKKYNDLYTQAELNLFRHRKINAELLEKDICKYIQQQTGLKLSDAETVWHYIACHYSYCSTEILFAQLDELIKLINFITGE